MVVFNVLPPTSILSTLRCSHVGSCPNHSSWAKKQKPGQLLVYVYGALVVGFALDVWFCEAHLQVRVHIFCFAVQLRDFLWDIFLDSLFLYKPM